MNYIDIIIGVVILFGFVRGIMRGLIIEIASIIGLVIGIYGAIHFSYIIGDYMGPKLDWDKGYTDLTAFAITFVVIVVLVALLGKMLTKVASVAALGLVNRIMGGVFGVLKYVIIIGAMVVFVDRTNKSFSLFNEDTIEKSVLYNPVKEVGNTVFKWILRDKIEIEEAEF